MSGSDVFLPGVRVKPGGTPGLFLVIDRPAAANGSSITVMGLCRQTPAPGTVSLSCHEVGWGGLHVHLVHMINGVRPVGRTKDPPSRVRMKIALTK